MRLQDSKIADLINGFLRGDLTQKQQNELDEWLSLPENKACFDRLCDKERILQKSFYFDRCDREKAWESIVIRGCINKTKKNRIIATIWHVAVAVLLPLVLGGIGYWGWLQTHATDPVVETSIEPGRVSAIVRLADGNIVNLRQDSLCHLTLKGGGALSNENGVLRFKSSEQKLNRGDQNYITFETPRGGEYKVVLPDGSRVWLNASSTLRFIEDFNGNSRKVYASGELYFEVARNEKKPFEVECNGSVIKVLGTEFNMRAYEHEPYAATLVSGSVLLTSGSKSVRLKPGQQALIEDGENSIATREVNIASVVAWKNGYFLFENARLEDIMRELGRWYDVRFVFMEETLCDERFSVEMKRHDCFSEALALLEKTGLIHFVVAGRVVYVK